MNAPVELEEIRDWPGTPGNRRFREAMRRVREGRAGEGDAATLRKILETPEYREWAQSSVQELTLARRHGLITDCAIEEITTRGSDEDFVGLSIMTDTGGGGAAAPRDFRLNIRFTRLSRDPQWMGLDGWLPLLEGLRVEILEGTDPGEPGAVVSVPASLPPYPHGTSEIPPGQPSRMAEIARWHGAAGCTWHQGEGEN